MAHPFITDAQATQKIQEIYTDIVNSIGTGFQGAITIADIPTEAGIYIPIEAGVYPNAGNLEYDPEGEDEGYLVMFIYDGDWTKNVTPINFTPTGEVEEGNPNAVSGGEVYNALIPNYFENDGYVNKYDGAVDLTVSSIKNYSHTLFLKIKDKSNLRVTGFSGVTNKVALVSFYDINCNYLSRYNADVTGSVTEHLVPESSIPDDAVYVRASRLTAEEGNVSGVYLDESIISLEFKPLPNIFTNIGYINKNNGSIVNDSDYRFSVFLKLINRNNLRVRGYSGATNNTSLVAFYDSNFKWLSSYNATTAGFVNDHLVPESEIPENTYYVVVGYNISSSLITSVTSVEIPNYTNPDLVNLNEMELKGGLNNIFNDENNGYVNKKTGVIIESTSYNYSNFLTIEDKTNLRVTGFSGVTNNVALVSFYDSNFIFIGYYNSTTHGQVSNHLVPEEEIPENTKYIRYTKHRTQSVLVQNAYRSYTYELSDMSDLIKSYKDPFFTISESDIFKNNGYVNKVTGAINEQSVYQYTHFLILTDRNGLRVTGFSGVTNNAALVGFYDSNFVFIGYYNATTHGTVSNHLVPEEEIPENTFYVRITKRETQAFLIEGVSSTFKVKELIDYIDNKKQNSGGYTRGVKANVDNGGHVKINNYLNNQQNIHPKVLYFENGWNGYKYWMAYTPYPFGDTKAENPCIAVSNDRFNWVTPIGLTNPLALAPDGGYNSDTHLVYIESTNTLECWYREYITAISRDAIVRRTTTDGITWTEPEYVLPYREIGGNRLSPAIIFEENKYKLWYCSGSKLMYMESLDALAWTTAIEVPIDLSSQNLNAWHVDVIRTDLGLEFALQAFKTGGNNNTSDLYYILYDGSTYSKPLSIIERGDLPTDLDYRSIYRASILKVDDIYHFYYSAIALSNFRAIYLSMGRDVTKLRGVNL